MKKNTLVKIATGVLSAVVLTLGVVAASNSRKIEIFFRNIKIMIDGAEYVPTDEKGNIVEPFIYNGTTYLPVRAVANAFDKDVKWDGKNATVYLGKEGRMEPDHRLDKVQYVDYREDRDENYMEIINGTITDYNGNIYTNGLVFNMTYWGGHEIAVDYPLNGQYSRLSGTIVLPESISTTTRDESNCGTSETLIEIRDENGEQLYRAAGITASMPFKFNIDVDGVSMITIYVETEDVASFVALTDLALYE